MKAKTLFDKKTVPSGTYHCKKHNLDTNWVMYAHCTECESEKLGKTLAGLNISKTFGDWQDKHLCPNCGKPRLDFTINNKNPIVCTSCGKHYGLVEVKSEPWRHKR